MAVPVQPCRYPFGDVIPFVILHLRLFTAFFYPQTLLRLAWAALTHSSIFMFGVSAGYHRFFSHCSSRLGQLGQFLMALLTQTLRRKGVPWWAAQNCDHHRQSDDEQDTPSPKRRGFLWSNAGWVLSNEHDDYEPNKVFDLAGFPELRWLGRHHWVPAVAFSALILRMGAVGAFFWGRVVSMLLLGPGAFANYSTAHLFRTRRLPTLDHSRGKWLFARITLGGGWHNNHQFSMGSCREGIRWVEIDVTCWMLKLLASLGMAMDLRSFWIPAPMAQGAK